MLCTELRITQKGLKYSVASKYLLFIRFPLIKINFVKYLDVSYKYKISQQHLVTYNVLYCMASI